MSDPLTKVLVRLLGCDDRTEFLLDCSPDEISLLNKLTEESDKVSTYGCMPKLKIEFGWDHVPTYEEREVREWEEGNKAEAEAIKAQKEG